jgi:hypothetical protein
MKAHLVTALAFTSLAATAFLVGPASVTPAFAATVDKPLQLNGQKSTAHRSATKKARKKNGKSARTPQAVAPASTQAQGDGVHTSDRTAPETAGGSNMPENNMPENNMPLPVTVVRTTRIVNGAEISSDIPVVSEDEFNELDRIAAAPPLLVVTIAHYLGGPALIDEADAEPIQTAEVGGEARAAFAWGAGPAEKPHGIGLQYVLMTFGGALAAAAAARRLFAA